MGKPTPAWARTQDSSSRPLQGPCVCPKRRWRLSRDSLGWDSPRPGLRKPTSLVTKMRSSLPTSSLKQVLRTRKPKPRTQSLLVNSRIHRTRMVGNSKMHNNSSSSNSPTKTSRTTKVVTTTTTTTTTTTMMGETTIMETETKTEEMADPV